MNIEFFRNFCIKKKGTTEEFPFDKNILVYKVMGKMFALTNVENFSNITIKCDPEAGIELREYFVEVKPGYHSNKRHWISVSTDGSISEQQFSRWIDNSYNLVVANLAKSKKLELLSL